MVDESTLCSACKTILAGKPEHPQRGISGPWRRSNLHSSREATENQCWICTIIWKNIGKDAQNIWLSHSGWMEYWLYMEQDDGSVVLETSHSDMRGNMYRARLWIIPFTGECECLLCDFIWARIAT